MTATNIKMVVSVVMFAVMVSIISAYPYDYHGFGWGSDCVGQFTCRGYGYGHHRYTSCIDHSLVCDGTCQCPNGDDEKHCDSRCALNAFRCGNGKCVGGDKLCDTFDDCGDNTDETIPNCGCAQGEYTCETGDGCLDLETACPTGQSMRCTTDTTGNLPDGIGVCE